MRAHRLFFPAAAIHGAIAIGAWSLVGDAIDPSRHAHAMVFGYAAAVIAGFLLTRATRWQLGVAFGLWLAARLAWEVPGVPGPATAALSAGSTLIIAGLAARGFVRGVKQGRNAVFPVLLGALALCDLIAQFGWLAGQPRIAASAVHASVMLVVLLIVVMGGRIAGAALSGLSQRTGGPRLAPQPRLERSLVVVLPGILAAEALGLAAVSAGLCAVAAGIIAVRMFRWRSALKAAAPEMRAVVAAQGFVAAGLAGMAVTAAGAPWPVTGPLHLMTVGGIGIATAAMMLKTRAQRERLALPGRPLAVAAVLIGVSAVLRAGGYAAGDIAYPAAGLAWIVAMAICLSALLARR